MVQARNPESPALVVERLKAADLDPGFVRVAEPELFAELVATCSDCQCGDRCKSDFAEPDACEKVAAYCPNTPRVDELTVAKPDSFAPVTTWRGAV
ncbi:MAG: hypothetical protein C0511_00345 [Hyphomicrobium sp.]|mgnify:CR=1 FL=1|nr:hypothetical protein [Hyphomicrobium sp.]PPC84309.1 MAG: hypothetical protein CTY40_00345 [Hyphomicrobium sp.]